MRKIAGKVFDLATTVPILLGFLSVMLFAYVQQLSATNISRWSSLSGLRKLSFPVLSLLALFAGASLFNASATVLNPQERLGPNKIVVIATPGLGKDSFLSQVSLFGERVALGFGIDHAVAKEFAVWILEAAERQKLSPELIASLVLTESSFRKHVVSHVGAVGPTQVRPDYWASFCGATNLKDPEQNVYCGAQVLRHLVDRCAGNFDCALSAYNVGFNTTPGPAAARYVAKIDLHMDWLENAL
jgi:hypothetical protein